MNREPEPHPAASRRGPRGIALALAGIFSLLLTAQHLGSAGLPGCGAESTCAAAFASVWGSLPGLGWPTAYLGTAYFLALLVAWILRAGELGPLRTVLRLGAGASAVLVLAMLFDTGLCPYCLAAHVAHLTFFLLEERTPRGTRAPWVPFLATFALTTAALAFMDHRLTEERRDDQAAELEDSLGELGRAAAAGTFTGRYVEGPAEARVRLVVISDYQCPDCRRVEGELQSLRERYPADVSLSAKHFPFCTDCNPNVPRNLHPNACRAARAAEAAGIVGGSEGFWRMHRWLFAQKGEFTADQLRGALGQLGLEEVAFLRAMESPRTLELVQADVREALALGLHFTPMVFANGTELRGWRTARALERAVDKILSLDPEPADAGGDRPMDAAAKYVADWEAEPARNLPAPGRGPGPKGTTQVVVWGDYLEPTTRELDRRLRGLLERHPEASYSFRSFPLEPECNPHAPRAMSPGACLAARAAEAAFTLGGPDALERMQAALMGFQGRPDAAALARLAAEQGLSEAAFRSALASERVARAVDADLQAAKRLGLRSIPFFFVDGRRVPRWRLEGHDVLADLLRVAAER